MANIAEKVTKLNGFSEIKVINKHSTNVTVGQDGDMQVCVSNPDMTLFYS